jgi:glycosyltransferase involved in cell wall biosynthesis
MNYQAIKFKNRYLCIYSFFLYDAKKFNKRSCMLVIFFIFLSLFSTLEARSKIIGLVPMRNEAIMIEQCLRGLSMLVDEIIILDDASSDSSVAIVESLASECKVTQIIRKETWYRDEPGDRNALLYAGRAHGGTHFVVIDADEMFTGNFLDNNYLRTIILNLNPGDILTLNWIQLWRSVDYYRFDDSVWTYNYKPFVFCDEPEAHYSSDFIHTARIPWNLKGKNYMISGYEYGLMHFQFVNYDNVIMKHCWYRCLERIRTNKSGQEINAIYDWFKPQNIHLEPAPRAWFDNYSFFDRTIFTKEEKWRKVQIKEWLAQYGHDFFKDLDIWFIDWSK